MPARPIEILMEEHRIIEKALAAMRHCAEVLEKGGAVDAETLRGFVPFMREFADTGHHGKEEHRLFPLLVEKGLPARNGPIQAMCSEHEKGRRLVGEMENAVGRHLDGQAGAAGELAAVMVVIADFYARHIWKEDNVLFPMADRILGAGEVAGLIAAFDEVDGRVGAVSREHSVSFAQGLTEDSNRQNPS